jgi:hypothetical protein
MLTSYAENCPACQPVKVCIARSWDAEIEEG